VKVKRRREKFKMTQTFSTPEINNLVNKNLSAAALERAAAKLFADGKDYTNEEIKDLLQSKGILEKVHPYLLIKDHGRFH
jgi:hypothetical protein